MRVPIVCLLALSACCSSRADVQDGDDVGSGIAPKKLIALGWDSPTPALMLQNLKAMEQTAFSGVALSLSGTDDRGRTIRSNSVFTNEPWRQEWFQKDIETLKQVKSSRLTDNFLACDTTPASKKLFPDLFDDSAWKNVAGHFRILASIAKEAGLKGILFDPEAYTLSAFGYERLPGKGGRSFAECAAKLRQRGREVMSAMGGEYPGMTLFTLFMNSGTAMGALGADPREGLEKSSNRYNLYPAFVNGWLDTVPPSMTIVDGFEMAYPHSSELQYLKIGNAIRNTSLALIASGNQVKYRAQVRAGVSIYLDAYLAGVNDVHSDVYLDPPLTGSLTDRLGAAVISAFEVADEYVWVYGEQYRWWPTDNPRVNLQSWEDILPGISQKLHDATNTEKRAEFRAGAELAIAERKAALRNSALPNLVGNGDFNSGSCAIAHDAEHSNDAWVVDSAQALESAVQCDPKFGYGKPGSLRLENAPGVCVTRTLPVKPYTFYAVRARVRQIGKGTPLLRVHWQASGRKDAREFPPTGSAADRWQQISVVMRAPAGASHLQLCLVAAGQETRNSIIWFDDIQVYEIGVN